MEDPRLNYVTQRLTLLVRGSARRITTMTWAPRPIREYQCDQPPSGRLGS